jgi:DNA-binding transcriptional LysR family regulator
MGQVPEQLHVTAKPFLNNPLVVLASPEHPLVNKSNISLEKLSKETILLREAGSGTRLAMERCFASHNLELPQAIELGSTEAIKQGVIAGLGISVLSKHAVTLELAMGIVKLLDVDEFPLERNWYVAHLADKEMSLVARTFLEFLLNSGSEVVKEISQQFNKS